MIYPPPEEVLQMVDHVQPGGKEQQWGLCNNMVFILKDCLSRKRFLPIGPWPFSRQRDRRCTSGCAVVQQHDNQIHRRTLEASPLVVLLHVVVLYPVSHSVPTSIRAVHFRRTVFGILIKCVIYILLQKKKKQPTGFG